MSASGTHAHPIRGAVIAQRLRGRGEQPAAVAAPAPARLDEQGAHLGDRRPVLPAVVRGGAEADGPLALVGDEHVVPAAGTDRGPPGLAGLRGC